MTLRPIIQLFTTCLFTLCLLIFDISNSHSTVVEEVGPNRVRTCSPEGGSISFPQGTEVKIEGIDRMFEGTDASSIYLGDDLYINADNVACMARFPYLRINLSTIGLALTDLKITNQIASLVFDNVRICGSNWMRYDHTTMAKSLGDYKLYVEEKVEEWQEEKEENNGQSQYIQDLVSESAKEYREWY